jgi:hypothetical protein
MVQLGQTPDLIQNADMSKFTDRVEIKEGINTHRVLTGPFLSRSVYWPTLTTEGGQSVQRMRSVIVPKTGSEVLKGIASVEKEVRRNSGETDPRSQFTPSNLYLYLIFNRDELVPEDEGPTVRVAGYKQTVYNRLVEIQNERSTKDQSKLKNGLIFMYDVQIKKTIGDKSKPRFTTKYTVDVDTENNKVMGQIPAELADYPFDKVAKVLDENDIWQYIFTPEELEAIQSCETDLLAETAPSTEEQIINKLKENPIFLGAKDSNSGTFLFPQNEIFMNYLVSNSLPLIDAAAQSQLPASSQEEKPSTDQPPQTSHVEVVTENKETPADVTVVETSPATEVTPEGGGDKIMKWGEEGKK